MKDYHAVTVQETSLENHGSVTENLLDQVLKYTLRQYPQHPHAPPLMALSLPLYLHANQVPSIVSEASPELHKWVMMRKIL